MLGEIASFRYGCTAAARDAGRYRLIRITDITATGALSESEVKYISCPEAEGYLLDKESVLVARTGATFGRTLYFDSDEPSVYASFLIEVSINKSVLLPRFYWHFAQSHWYWKQARRLVGNGGQQQFNANALRKIRVPVPPLSVQQQVVDILDRFDALTTSLTDGLPAEIEARRQQYEYYRDKLLSFPRKVA